MNKILLVLMLTIICCNGLTNAGLKLTIEPIATGYAVDNDYDGTFDSFYGTPRDDDDDVRVGLLSWGEARGYIEFKVNNIPDSLIEENTCNILHLDKIYLRRWWYSGSNLESKTSVYGYAGDGRADSFDVYKTNSLIKANVGKYELIDVTDFVTNLMNNNKIYTGFVLAEKRNGIILNYGAFYLNAIYIPEPCTMVLIVSGLMLIRLHKN